MSKNSTLKQNILINPIETKIKSVILDFGGVISQTLFETHSNTELALGLPRDSLKWKGPFDPKSDLLWKSMQNGEISERDYRNIRTREVGSLVGRNWTKISDFIQAARGAEPEKIVRPEALKIIRVALKKKIRLAILSNELDLFYGDQFRKKLSFLKYFETIHDATYTKILKPDPRAYQACLKEMQLSAENCLFIDDQYRNIVGAQKVGLKTVHFNVLNPSESLSRILKLLKSNE